MKTIPIFLIGWCIACVAVANAQVNPTGTTNDQAVALSQQADSLLQQTPPNDSEAAALLVKAANLDPDNLDIWLKVGWVYLDRLHDPQAAFPYLTVVVKHQPKNVDARRLYGMACTQTGRLEMAKAQFQEAAYLEPADLWIQANLARSLARLGEYRKAGEIYEEILKKDPNNADARLGQAELSAWRGHSASALVILDQLIKENPTNVDALTLRGDVRRWDWDMSQSEEDYREALRLVPNDHDATTGLAAADQMDLSNVTIKGYEFKDNTHFLQEDVELGTRLHLSDEAFLLARVAGWRFTNPGFNEVERLDGDAGLEYHFARYLEVSLEGQVFSYKDSEAFYGGTLSAKLSPLTGCDIYTVLSANQPFISSMPTVSEHLKQSSIGNGVDINIAHGFSVQNSLTGGEISDGNNWFEEKPQISYRLFGSPLTFIRAEYDYLRFSQPRTTYWSPGNWQTLSPVIDTTVPLGKAVHLNLKGSAPYVLDASSFGFVGEGGLVVDCSRWLRIGASYIYASVPGDPKITVNRPPWSGHGGQAFVQVSF